MSKRLLARGNVLGDGGFLILLYEAVKCKMQLVLRQDLQRLRRAEEGADEVLNPGDVQILRPRGSRQQLLEYVSCASSSRKGNK